MKKLSQIYLYGRGEHGWLDGGRVSRNSLFYGRDRMVCMGNTRARGRLQS